MTSQPGCWLFYSLCGFIEKTKVFYPLTLTQAANGQTAL